MRLEHHLVGGYVRYISPYIIIIIITVSNICKSGISVNELVPTFRVTNMFKGQNSGQFISVFLPAVDSWECCSPATAPWGWVVPQVSRGVPPARYFLDLGVLDGPGRRETLAVSSGGSLVALEWEGWRGCVGEKKRFKIKCYNFLYSVYSRLSVMAQEIIFYQIFFPTNLKDTFLIILTLKGVKS